MEIKIQPLDKLAEAAKYFLQKVITPPLEELGLLTVDNIKLWRFKNQVNILCKAEDFLKEKGIKTRKVSLKVLTPLLEECSMEEDSSLQEKWALLIANTVCEGSNLDSTLYSHTLSQLSKEDANLFELVIKLSTVTKGNEVLQGSMTASTQISIKKLKTENKDIDLQLDNLLRLRLIKEITTYSMNTEIICLTDLGLRFMSAISKS